MSALTFKRRKNLVSSPLPKRNKRVAILRRIAAKIKGQLDLDKALMAYPPYMREAFLKELEPHLSFEMRDDS